MLHFVGDGDQEKFTKKNPPFFNAKFPGKLAKKFHKSFLERGQSKKVIPSAGVPCGTRLSAVKNRWRRRATRDPGALPGSSFPWC